MVDCQFNKKNHVYNKIRSISKDDVLKSYQNFNWIYLIG